MNDSFYWNKNIIISWTAQFSLLIMFIFGYDTFPYWATMIWETYNVMPNFTFWVTVGLIVIVAVLPVEIYNRISRLFNDDIINNIRIQKYKFGLKKKKIEKQIERVGELTRSFAKFKKILNHQKFVADNHADKKIKVLVDQFENEEDNEYFPPGQEWETPGDLEYDTDSRKITSSKGIECLNYEKKLSKASKDILMKSHNEKDMKVNSIKPRESRDNIGFKGNIGSKDGDRFTFQSKRIYGK